MIVTRTPFRVSFFGGGTDYPEHFEKHGGAVLATAIDKAMFLSATQFYSRLFDYCIRISYRQVECVKSVDDLQHVPFREVLKWCGVTRDVEVDCAAELPSFSGLGSSSSFVVGLLNTLMAHQGKFVKPIDLAYQAIEIERTVLKEHVGCQDQLLAAVGGFNLIEFRRTDDIAVHRVPLGPERRCEFEKHLLMVYTGIRRRAEEQAARQVSRIGENTARLLRLRQLVDEAYESVVGGTFERFGRLMHESWVEKRALEESISNQTIDEIYSAGLDAGAWGGKLLGAGGGGFVLFFVAPERRAAVRQRLSHLEEIPIAINAQGSHVIYAS
jgi:D-glycero-alpha-D-manno-heptose-7-phosphate kinase